MLLSGCNKPRSPEPQTPAATAGEDTTGNDSDPIQGYNEGAALPDGWPAELIPLPEGAVPVANLDKSAVSDENGEGMGVFYFVGKPVAEIQAFLTDALPAKGWAIQETTPPDEYVMITAENQGYVGIFGMGVGFGPPQTSTGQKIDLQVLLIREL